MLGHSVDQGSEPIEVAATEELFILDKVLSLLPIVRLERLVLQELQVTLVELHVLRVLQKGRSEEALNVAPFERVA